MNMTHKEALRTAIAEHGDRLGNLDAMETAIRAYLDARGLVAVPRVATVEMEVSGTEDWLCIKAMEERAVAIWEAMLAAAPDPFADTDTTPPSSPPMPERPDTLSS